MVASYLIESCSAHLRLFNPFKNRRSIILYLNKLIEKLIINRAKGFLVPTVFTGVTIAFSCYSIAIVAANNIGQIDQQTVEELRVVKALEKIPEVASRFSALVEDFAEAIIDSKSFDEIQAKVVSFNQRLWRIAINSYKLKNDFDDRPLYWARLQMASQLRQADSFSKLSLTEQSSLMWQLEMASRGQTDIDFDQQADLKVILTGFDPFFLDRNLDQSNPSGAVASALDNQVIRFNGQTVEIETVIVPVRFADFDQGMIEAILTPYMKDKKVDMIITVSMGREDFDLERYPGKRRSAKAPDNLNVYTGASSENPIVPSLNGKPIEGPEFVRFSLPVDEMKTAKGDFAINDNNKITTTERTYKVQSLLELKDKVSVQGSGGGYLSNEISYRSILLRNKLSAKLPVGHVHTPRFKGFKPRKTEKIIEQVKEMLKQAITTL